MTFQYEVAQNPMSDAQQKTAPPGPCRVGIVGAGLMGWWHAHTVARIGGQVVGVADPLRERGQKIADKFGAEPYVSTEEMLQGPEIDILHICSNSASHDAIIRQALQQNVHVFVEKPLAETLAQTRSLISLTQKAGKALCPVHQYAFQRSVETILAQRSRAGNITHMDLQFFSAGGDATPVAGHPQIAADILPHPISILSRFFPDHPLADLGWTVLASAHAGWEIATQIDGIFVRISISLQARPTCAALTLHGDRGSFVADLFHDYVLFRDGTASRRTKMQRPFTDALGHLLRATGNMTGRLVRREPAYPGLQTLTRRFHAACAGNGPQPVSARDIMAAAALRDQFLQSTLPDPKPEARQ